MEKRAIGGSDIAAIMGVNEYRTPFQVWFDKTSEVKSFEGNERTEAGNILEPVILNQFASKTLIRLSKPQDKFVHKVLDYCICFVDNIGNEGAYVVSAKNTGKEIDQFFLPLTWTLQLNWEMGLSEINEGYITWLSKGWDFGHSKIAFDADLFDEQLQHAKYFWENYVLTNIAPPPINSSDIVSRIVPKAITKEAPPELLEVIGNLREVKAKIKDLEKEKDKYDEAIKMHLVEADTLMYGSKIIATWKQNKDGKEFDKKALEETYPEVYNEFVKEKKGARVLLLK